MLIYLLKKGILMGNIRRGGAEGNEEKSRARAGDHPTYCDYRCTHAAFGPPDASGACRRDLAVFCRLLGRYNAKNARCLLESAGT